MPETKVISEAQMRSTIASLKKKMAILIVFVMIFSGLGSYFIFRDTDDPSQPIASFSVSKSSVITGEIITCNASLSSDPDDKALTFAWDFGDGSIGEGMIVTHSFSSVGNNSILLTVENSEGEKGTESILVRVVAPGPLDIPRPFFASPTRSHAFPETIVIGNITDVSVGDLNGGNITSINLTYSSDGVDWISIGLGIINLDEVAGGGGNGIGGSCCNGPEDRYWSLSWNLTDLPEGEYRIQAVMVNDLDQIASVETVVFFDPTPPLVLYPDLSFFDTVSGTITLTIETADEDAVSAEFYEFEPFLTRGGAGSYWEDGLGEVDTGDVGASPNGESNYCGPTAAANALLGLAKDDPSLLVIPRSEYARYNRCFRDHQRAMRTNGTGYYTENDDGQRTLTPLGLAVILACKMRTSPIDGTSNDDLDDGLVDFLREQGKDEDYVVDQSREMSRTNSRRVVTDVTGSCTGSDNNYYPENIMRGEAVMMLLIRVDLGEDGLPGTADDSEVEGSGHWITGSDYSYWYSGWGSIDGNFTSGQSYSFVDPSGTGSPLPHDENSPFGRYGSGTPTNFKYTKNGVDYDVKYLLINTTYFKIIHTTAVSPNPTRPSTTQGTGYRSIGTDETPAETTEGGRLFSFEVDITDYPDGIYSFASAITDTEKNIGWNDIWIFVDNDPPAPLLEVEGTPMEEMTFTISDGLENEDYAGMNVQWYHNESWMDFGVDLDGSDGFSVTGPTNSLPSGDVLFIVAVRDFAGTEGSVDYTLTMPSVSLSFQGPVSLGGDATATTFLTSSTNVTVLQSGSELGNVSFFRTSVDGTWGEFNPYDGSIRFEDIVGPVEMEYFTQWDNGYESDRMLSHLIIDDSAPQCTIEVGQPSSDDGKKLTSETPIWLNATDVSLDGDEGVGVQSIHYEIWKKSGTDESYDKEIENITIENNSVIIILPETGEYEIRIFATDHLGNTSDWTKSQHEVEEPPA